MQLNQKSMKMICERSDCDKLRLQRNVHTFVRVLAFVEDINVVEILGKNLSPPLVLCLADILFVVLLCEGKKL